MTVERLFWTGIIIITILISCWCIKEVARDFKPHPDYPFVYKIIIGFVLSMNCVITLIFIVIVWF